MEKSYSFIHGHLTFTYTVQSNADSTVSVNASAKHGTTTDWECEAFECSKTDVENEIKRRYHASDRPNQWDKKQNELKERYGAEFSIQLIAILPGNSANWTETVVHAQVEYDSNNNPIHAYFSDLVNDTNRVVKLVNMYPDNLDFKVVG